MSEARQDLSRNQPLRGYDLRAVVAGLPGSVLDRLLDLALARHFAEVEAELLRRSKKRARMPRIQRSATRTT